MGSLVGGKGGAPEIPDAPDPRKLARLQAETNRGNQITPFGSLTFSGPNRRDARIRLTPQQQRLVNLAISSAGEMPAPLDAQAAGDRAFQAFASRINPDFDRRQAILQEQLMQSGNPAVGADLAPGAVSELDILNRARNDALMQAGLQAEQIGSQSRLADIQGTAAFQNLLNNNALQFGGGLLMPIQQSPIDLLGGFQLQQNAQLGNAQMANQRAGSKNSLFGQLGSAAIGGFF